MGERAASEDGGRGPIAWVMIIPFFKPAPGGCAVYIDTISREFARAGDRVLIVTEGHPGTPRHEVLEGTEGRVSVARVFPFRAGRARKDWRSFVAYAVSNLRYLQLPGMARRWLAKQEGEPRVLVHTSLLYNPNSLKHVLGGLRGSPRTRLIADVRDMQYPDAELGLLDRFDRVTTSSMGVAEDLVRRGVGQGKVHPIPMPFVPPPVPDDEAVAAVLEKYGLAGRKFLLNPNGVMRAKHYPEMREAIPLVRREPGLEDVMLVSVGRDRDRTAADDQAERAGLAKFLGPVMRDELFALMRAAWFTLVLSPNEAISRAALEAMAVGGRAILPDVAEFRAECASHICSRIEPAHVAELVVRLADAPMPAFGFERHDAARYVPLYRAPLGEA